MNMENKNPPKLEWFNLYHGQKHAGDILASFELVYKKVGKHINTVYYET